MVANYQPPETVEKRVRFFDGQFLEDQDFVDEQNYHVDRERRHNRLLHVAGIADGLAVAASGANRVTVAPGTAIDADGRQVVLATEAGVDLPAETCNGVAGIKLYLAYQETQADRQQEGSADDTRWLERPQVVRILPGESYSGTAPTVLLAGVSVDASGAVTVNASGRQYSGVRLPGPAADAAVLRTTASGGVTLAGSLTVQGFSATTVDVAGKADTPGQTSLRLRSGNSSANYDSNQITFGRAHGWFRHAVKTRHNESARVGNAIDFYVWSHTAPGGGSGAIGGTHALTLDGGDVGIGTTTPENAEGWNKVVDVLGSVSTKLSVRTANIDARVMAHDTGHWGSPAAMVVGTKTNHPLIFGTNSIARMVLTNQGRVGIGTTATSGLAAKLDIQQAPRTGTHPSGGAVKGLYVTGDFGAGSDGVEFRHSNATQGIGIAYSAIYAAGTEANQSVNLLPKGSGGVGIRTESPLQDLSVNGRMSVDNGVIQRGGSKITNTSDLGLYSQISGGPIRIVTNNAPINFYTDGGVGSTARISISTGGVVIGASDQSLAQANSVSGGTVMDRLYVTDTLVFWETNFNQWRRIRDVGNENASTRLDGGPSDLRLKTALRPIRDALDKVLRLQGMHYRWGEAGLDYFTKDIPGTVCAGPGGTAEDERRLWTAEREKVCAALAGGHIGLVAQEVEPVVPEVVSEDRDGYKHIRYQHLTALLVEAIKEQHALVQALATRLAALEPAPGPA